LTAARIGGGTAQAANRDGSGSACLAICGPNVFDQPGQVPAAAGDGLASYPAIARAIPRVEITASAARAGRASPAPPGPKPAGRTEGRSCQMLSSRHAPRRWKRRYGFGKVGNRTLPFGAKRQQSPQNTASVLRTRRRRFAVTASRASGSGNVVSKISQARGMAVEAQDRDHSRHHPPYPFFSEMRRNGRARRRRIVGRRSAHFENERSRILASPNESRCAGARRWRSALPKSS